MKKILGMVGLALSLNANAGLITTIDEATIANGDHNHSTDGGRAAVGYWNSEESRAVVEFDAASIVGETSGFLSFDLALPDGLFYGHDQNYLGDFNIYAFTGDGTVSYGDYSLTSTLLGSATAAGLSLGDTITLDISAFLSTFNSDYIGIVFDPTSTNPGSIVQETMFNNFQIETTASVPEPTGIALLGLGLAGIGFSRKKKKSA